MVSPYAEKMLEQVESRWAEGGAYDSTHRIAAEIFHDIRAALFGPPPEEVAGTCDNCGEVADVWGQDFCRSCWGE